MPRLDAPLSVTLVCAESLLLLPVAVTPNPFALVPA